MKKPCRNKTRDKYYNLPFTNPGVSKHDNGEVAEARQLHLQRGMQTRNHLRRGLLQIGIAGKPEQPSQEH